MRMSSLQAEHGRNVVSTLAKGKPMCKRNPDHAEYSEFSWAGSSASSCGGIHSNWVENRVSLAFNGPISRYYVVLELCGMDLRSLCKLSTQCSDVIKASARHALSRIKRGIPTSCKDELAVTSDGI